MKQLNANNFDSETTSGVSLVDFYADWCPPCRALAPTLETFEQKHSEEVHVGKVDIDNEQDLAKRFNVRSVPTLIAFRDGKEVNRAVGNLSISELEELVDP